VLQEKHKYGQKGLVEAPAGDAGVELMGQGLHEAPVELDSGQYLTWG
jgi:hypothetical protein